MINKIFEYNNTKYSIQLDKTLPDNKIFEILKNNIGTIGQEFKDSQTNSKVTIKRLTEADYLQSHEFNVEIAFAMHLFRNADSEIFSTLTGKELELNDLHNLTVSFSDAIHIWIQFFEQTLPYTDSDDEKQKIEQMLPALKDLEEFQKEIGRLSLIKNKKECIKGKQELSEKIEKKAKEALESKRPFYMPGGYVNPKEGKIVPMIYEISKNEGDAKFFKMRIVDLSKTVKGKEEVKREKIEKEEGESDWHTLLEKPRDKVQASFTFKKDIRTLSTTITDSLDAQISPSNSLFNKKIGLFDAVKTMLRKPKEEEFDRDRSKIFTKIIAGENIGQEEIKIKKQKTIHPEKLLEVFLKAVAPEVYKGKKTLFKISSFLSLYHQLEKRLEDPKIRKWLKINAESLLNTLNKKVEEKDPKTFFLHTELKKIIDTLETFDVKQKTTIPGSAFVSKKDFTKPLNTPTLENSEKFKISGVRSPTIAPLKEITSNIINNTEIPAIIELFRENLTVIQKLTKKGDVKNASLLLEDYSRILDNKEALDLLLKKIASNEKASEELVGILKDFNFLALEINYRLGFVVPEPRFIHYNLQSLVVADKLFRMNPNCELNGYKFDMAPIEQTLQDSFLNLGSKGIQIAQDLEYLSSPTKSELKPIRLTNPELYIYEKDEDIEFCKEIANRKIASEEKPALEKKVKNIKDGNFPKKLRLGIKEDIGQRGLLSKQLTDMRQMYIMTQGMLAPTRTLLVAGIGSITSLGMNLFEEIREGQGREKIYPGIVKEVIHRLKTMQGPIKITVVNSHFGYGNQFFIEPWGLAIQDFDDALDCNNFGQSRLEFEHPELYKENSIPLEDEKTNNVLFKQNVALQQADRVDDEGRISEESSSVSHKYKTYGVRGKVQLSILREKLNLLGLPSDIVQDLQLMETGDETRIKETVGKLTKYASLLNEGKQASILTMLFERNFFRKNLLLKTLTVDPGYAKVLISTLKEISQNLEDSHHYRAYLFIHDLCNQIGGVLTQIDVEKIKAPLEELQKMQSEFQNKISQFKEKADRKESPYFSCQREFHFYFLLNAEAAMESKPLSEIYSDAILKSYFHLKNSAGNIPLDPQKLNRIEYFMHRLLPEIQLRLKKPEESKRICNEFLKFFMGVDSNDSWIKEGKSGLIFKNGTYTIDFKEGIIWKKNKRISFLPGNLLKHPDLEKVQDILKKNGYEGNLSVEKMTVCNISYNKIEGVRYDFSLKIKEETLNCRIIAANDGSVRFYKQIKKNWYQFQPDIGAALEKEKEALEPFPLEITKYNVWIKENGKKLIAENEAGQVVYTGTLSGRLQPTIVSLTDQRNGETVLNPWNNSEFNVFRNIEETSHITVKGKSGKADEVSYNRFKLTFKWNQKEEKWISPQHPTHYLSGRTPAEYFSKKYQEDSSVPPYDSTELQKLFSGTFIHYQFLESNSDWPKVILTGVKYAKTQQDLFTKKIKPTPQFDEKNEHFPLFVFTADPNQGLKTDNPDGYLYLAYTLLTQGKYKEALRYLKKGDINQPFSETGTEIFKWIQHYEDKSPDAAAFKMHAILLRSRQISVLTPLAKQTQSELAMIEPIHFEIYKKLVEEGKIPVELQLSEKEREDYAKHAEKLVLYVAAKLKGYQKEINALIQAFEQEIDEISKKDKASEKLESTLSLFEILNKNEHETIKRVLGELHITLQELLAWQKEGILGLSEKDLRKRLIEKENQFQMRQKNSYKNEIHSLKQIIEKREQELNIVKPLTKAIDAPIPILSLNLDHYFQEEKVVDEKAKNLTVKVKEFSDAISYEGKQIELDQEYAKEIGKELAEDLKFNIDKQNKISGRHILQNPSEKSSQINTIFETHQNNFDKGAKSFKKEVLTLLPLEPKKGRKWDELLNLVKERNSNWQESIFDTALRCFGEDDWSLIEQLYGNKEQFNEALPKLKTACREFLKSCIRSRQCGRGKAAFEELSKLHDEIQTLKKNQESSADKEEDFSRKSQELHTIINEGWNYDPDKDVDARSLLLIEYELGFICRASQVSVVRETLNKDNPFKQEICGGGKTTVLRNIITHVRANGVNLSAVSTLEPLRKTHGVLFSRTTLHAFGEKSFVFIFNRTTPSDEASLLKLHRNLLNVIVERGRVDLTKGDQISLGHEQTLKQDLVCALKKSNPKSPLIESLQKEIDIMEDISDLLNERTVINSDELDKDCDATQEKNYAYGNLKSFHEDKMAAALELMKKILTSENKSLKKLKKAIQTNKQSNLSLEDIKAARLALAEDVFNSYAKELELENHKIDFIAYLNEIPDEDQKKSFKDFYDIHIKPKEGDEKRKTAIKNKTCFMHEFLTHIIPSSFTKIGGVNFGRSRDELHVIPFAGSDRPKEGSQHGLNSEQIWYTLIDYADSSRGGITEDQIALLVANAKNRAREEIDTQRKLNPNAPLAFEKTAAAKEFKEKFTLLLHDITEKDFKTISERINADPESLISFVKDWVLPEYQLHSEKIEGDSQDPPNMARAYFGSAGTDYAKYSMPDPIDISNVRQQGVHGEILRCLIEIDSSLQNKKINPFLTPEGEDPNLVLKLLKEQVKGGDSISDVGVAFPGWPASRIAVELSKMKPELTIRFINRQDEWQMCQNGKIIPLDPNTPLKEVFTIFDDTHTRGAERPSIDGVTVYVTIDENTSLSKFEQGVLRERGVPKGKAVVRYILSPSLQAKWGGEPDLNKLFRMLVENEAKEMKTLNMKAEKQKIRAIAKHGIKKAIRVFTKASKEEIKVEKVKENLQSIIKGIKEIEKFDETQFKSTIQSIDEIKLPEVKVGWKDIFSPVKKAKEVIGQINNFIDLLNQILKINLEETITNLENAKKEFKDQEIIEHINNLLKELEIINENVTSIQKLIPGKIDTSFTTIFGIFSRYRKIVSSRKGFETLASQFQEKKLHGSIEKLQKAAGTLKENISITIERTGETLKGDGVPTHWAARDLIFECARNYFIKPTAADPIAAGQPSEMKKSGDVLKDLANEEYNKLNNLIKEDGELLRRARATEDPAVIKDVEAFCKNIKEHAIPKLEAKFNTGVSKSGHKGRLEERLLPEKVSNKEDELDQEQSVEQEQEMEIETEQEQEQETERERKEGITEIEHKPLKLKEAFKSGPMDFVDFFVGEGQSTKKNFYKMNDYVPHQPENKFFTENFSPVSREEARKVKPWSVQAARKSLPPDQNRISRTLFIINTKTGKVSELIPSLKDNDTEIEEYVRSNSAYLKEKGFILSMYNYDTDKVDGGESWDNFRPQLAKEVVKYIVSTKFQNGDVHYSTIKKSTNPTAREILADQHSALIDWLVDNKDKLDDLRRSFRKFIKTYRISNKYKGSSIEKAFKSTKNKNYK